MPEPTPTPMKSHALNGYWLASDSFSVYKPAAVAPVSTRDNATDVTCLSKLPSLQCAIWLKRDTSVQIRALTDPISAEWWATRFSISGFDPLLFPEPSKSPRGRSLNDSPGNIAALANRHRGCSTAA